MINQIDENLLVLKNGKYIVFLINTTSGKYSTRGIEVINDTIHDSIINACNMENDAWLVTGLIKMKELK